ncbi:MAG: hypothetical protein ACI30K_03650 [Muribaculaceae bacterium]
MKKLVLLLAVVFSVSLFSCGNAEKAAEATDSVAADSAVVEEVAAPADSVAAAADSAAVDSAAVVAE